MTPIRTPRWALSFADLCLVLLAFFVLLHARNGDSLKVAQSMRAAFGGAEPLNESAHVYQAAGLFEPGEAVLRPRARARLEALGRNAASRIRIASTGMDPGTRRFDRWELAAARVAAVARALQVGGVEESRIEVVMPQMTGAATGQRISVTILP
jgi:flagellar motor protein MotB